RRRRRDRPGGAAPAPTGPAPRDGGRRHGRRGSGGHAFGAAGLLARDRRVRPARRRRARRVRGRLRRRRRRRSSVAPAGARRVRRLAALGLVAVAVAAAGCGGGGSSTPATPTIPAARVTKVIDFAPGGSVAAGKPATISFRIQQADGSKLTKFRRGPGPHTGVHLIYVRDDLSTIIHHHPPLGGRGKIVDHVTFPAPGPYRLVIDVSPASCPGSATPAVPGAPAGTCNFQLFERVRVAGAYSPRPLPPTSKAQKDGGCRFTLDGAANLTA